MWTIPNSEFVFFVGKKAEKMPEVEFKDRKVKLRLADEEMSACESEDSDEDCPKLVIGDESKEEKEDMDPEKPMNCHRGIMVIQTEQVSEKVE